MKKKIKIAITSLSKGKESSKESTITFIPSIPDIVLRGLRTLNDLRAPRFTPVPKFNNEK